MIDNKSFELKNDFTHIDYLGLDNEATIYTIKEKKWDIILKNEENVITIPVNKEIKKNNYHQR